jgi:hypothetical protein
MKSKLPIKRLSEIAEIQMGQSPKGSSYNISGDGVSLINGPSRNCRLPLKGACNGTEIFPIDTTGN